MGSSDSDPTASGIEVSDYFPMNHHFPPKPKKDADGTDGWTQFCI